MHLNHKQILIDKSIKKIPKVVFSSCSDEPLLQSRRYGVASTCLFWLFFSLNLSTDSNLSVVMKDLFPGFIGSHHRIPVWKYKALGVERVCVSVCVYFYVLRVAGFRGSCLITYLYNLQKMGLAGEGGVLPSTNLPGNTAGQELFF